MEPHLREVAAREIVASDEVVRARGFNEVVGDSAGVEAEEDLFVGALLGFVRAIEAEEATKSTQPFSLVGQAEPMGRSGQPPRREAASAESGLRGLRGVMERVSRTKDAMCDARGAGRAAWRRAESVRRWSGVAHQRSTQGPIFDARRRAQHAPPMLELDEEAHARSPFGAADDKLAVAEITRILESRGGSELVDAMLATHGADESLKDYVARNYEHATVQERAAAYDRLKLARRDALAKLQGEGARAA